MNYHLIKTDDMLNGSGLRVVLFLSGCSHRCRSCHNPETWDAKSGKAFGEAELANIFDQMNNDYISGLTLSGGDPLYEGNLEDVLSLCEAVREVYGNSKTIWVYSGYTWDDIYSYNGVIVDDVAAKVYNDYILRRRILSLCDVLVDGLFEQDKEDVNYPWAGSTNQRVIDVQKTLETDKITLWLG